jgi:hypothetical protein
MKGHHVGKGYDVGGLAHSWGVHARGKDSCATNLSVLKVRDLDLVGCTCGGRDGCGLKGRVSGGVGVHPLLVYHLH